MKMTAINSALLRRGWLQVQIDARRLNPLTGLALLLLIAGLAAVTLWLPQQRGALEQAQQDLTAQQRSARDQAKHAPQLQLTQNQQRVKLFYDTLGDQGYAEQQLKALFAIAAKNGLSLSQGDYRNTFDRNSGVTAYQIDLPVTGPYPALRLFCEEALRTIPFASLDQISFKRSTVSSASLETHLVFTLYLTAADHTDHTDHADQSAPTVQP